MKMQHSIALSFALWSLASCSFLFGRSSTAEIVDKRELGNPAAHLVAIKECGLTARQSKISLARMRELFVGFSGVRLYDFQKIPVGAREVDRAFIYAELEGDRVQGAVYLLPLTPGCALDIVVWSREETDPVKIEMTAQSAVKEILQEHAPG